MDNGSLFDQQDNNEGGPSGALVPFEFPITGEPIRAAMLDGMPWLVAPDVCMILKHSNVTMAVKSLEEDERRVVHRGSSEALNFPDLFADQRIHSVTLINESGFYALAFRSKVQKARDLRKWVTETVLPSIRETGGYGVPQPRREPTRRELAMMVIEAEDRADRAEALATMASAKVLELTPGHELAETFAAANGTMTIRTFARNVQQWAQPRGIKVLQEHVFAYLGMIGMIIRADTSEKGQATANALKAGWCENATTDYETHTRGKLLTTYARLTPKGVNHAWKRIHSTIGEFNTLDPKVIRP
ncbi:BRO family protein [Nonomuraea wenchangensis]